MENLLKDLNPQQRHAVETTEGPVLVLSGAGTGKTRVLTTRIAYILQQNLALPWQVLALTFTNKAANEMKTRIAEYIGHDAARDLWMGTFHSVSLRILRANAEKIGLRRDFLVFGEDEQRTVLKTALANLNLDPKEYSPAEWIEKIAAVKDKGLTENVAKGMTKKIMAEYDAEMTRLGALDFGDLILKVLQMFASVPDVLSKYQRQFKYILVDEYQDTNAAQYQLLRMLAADKSNICCVGDDDQSIYSWRGAEIKNILNFEKEYKGTTVIRLETNYRSTANILGAANSLIKKNRERLGKDLKPAPGITDGSKIAVACVPTGYDEARIVADVIELGVRSEELGVNRACDNTRVLKQEQSTPNSSLLIPNSSLLTPNFSNFAVLIRAGSLSRLFEEEFSSRRIPYRLVGATKFYDRMEIRDAIAYLRLLCYPFDDISFARAISRPRRGFGDAALSKIREYARENKISLMRALRSVPLSGKQKTSADEFLAAFDFDWSAMPPADAAMQILENSGYMKSWRESKEIDAPDRIANVNDLVKNAIARYDTLTEFLEHAALMMTEDGENFTESAVSIMTIHAAKGLEFDNVFLPAWETKIFPNEKAMQDNGIEEERRLAYVAITRARKNAMISYTMARMVFGQIENNEPSQFIKEIDNKYLEFSGIRPYSGAQNSTARPQREQRNRPLQRSTMVGKLVNHSEFGNGVVIEQDSDIVTVAFRDKGIKKVRKDFLI